MPQLRRRLKRFARGLLGQADPMILMYHRVAAVDIDPWGLAVRPDNFAAQMRMLIRMRRPVPLDWMVERLRAGNRPVGTVAITFDDAYRDVLRNAKPILAELGIPATVFVVTGKLGSEQGFWWDRLADSVFGGDWQSAKLDFSFVPGEQLPSLEAARVSGNMDDLHVRLWNLVRVLDPEEREAAVDQITAVSGRISANAAPVMTREELGELIDGGVINVGAHTVSHPSLPSLSPEAQRTEISESRNALETLIGRPVKRLAYPFGDYDEHSRAIARELGFDYAVSVETGPVNDPAARFHLPRHDIKNWNGVEFGKRLRWLN